MDMYVKELLIIPIQLHFEPILLQIKLFWPI